MRTYDKLIATITAPQAGAGLHPSAGPGARAHASIERRCVRPGEEQVTG